MTDTRTRALAREGLTAAWIRARMRSGELPHRRVYVASLLGSAPAAEALGDPPALTGWRWTDGYLDHLNSDLDAAPLRIFAADCAERALLCAEAEGDKPDPRSLQAVEVARAHARGEASDSELAAARADAQDDTWAAWAAEAAAWGAAEAARAAAWGAARTAARDAARAAARDAAWAVWDAATWDAERAWQAERLAGYLLGWLS